MTTTAPWFILLKQRSGSYASVATKMYHSACFVVKWPFICNVFHRTAPWCIKIMKCGVNTTSTPILFACLELLACNKHTVKAVQWVQFLSTYSYVTIASYIGPVMYEVSTVPKCIAHSISSCHVARTKICLRMQISVGSCSGFHSIVCHVQNQIQSHT